MLEHVVKGRWRIANQSRLVRLRQITTDELEIGLLVHFAWCLWRHKRSIGRKVNLRRSKVRPKFVCRCQSREDTSRSLGGRSSSRPWRPISYRAPVARKTPVTSCTCTINVVIIAISKTASMLDIICHNKHFMTVNWTTNKLPRTWTRLT